MRTATVELESASPYSSSGVHQTPKLDKETHDDYEKRTWRERILVNDQNQIIIPPTAFTNGLSDTARFMPKTIPGRRGATYTKYVESGLLVMDPVVLHGPNNKPIPKDEVKGEWRFVPADGRTGGGRRVWKCFALIPQWKGTLTLYVVHDLLTPPIIEEYFNEMGLFIGLGRFRPQKRGFYGRFTVKKVSWS